LGYREYELPLITVQNLFALSLKGSRADEQLKILQAIGAQQIFRQATAFVQHRGKVI
jgi:hypothetical protein